MHQRAYLAVGLFLLCLLGSQRCAWADGEEEADPVLRQDVTELEVEVTFKPEGCDTARKSKAGDKLFVHYTGYLVDGTIFDSSIQRDLVWDFVLGSGTALDGWDAGMYDACVGEKRILSIPPHLGYGDVAVGSIQPGSSLFFETEIIKIESAEGEAVAEGAGADEEEDEEVYE